MHFLLEIRITRHESSLLFGLLCYSEMHNSYHKFRIVILAFFKNRHFVIKLHKNSFLGIYGENSEFLNKKLGQANDLGPYSQAWNLVWNRHESRIINVNLTRNRNLTKKNWANQTRFKSLVGTTINFYFKWKNCQYRWFSRSVEHDKLKLCVPLNKTTHWSAIMLQK